MTENEDPDKGSMNEDEKASDKQLIEESNHLGLAKNEERWALCLSGGGIRSATFSLGVLQGLAKRKMLERFHYLSTVSGGGYIGSWLSSWIARNSGGITDVQDQLAKDKEPDEIRRLRAYSNYLSPTWGLSTDFFTLVSTYLRNLLLNWLVLVPLLLAAVALPRLYLSLLRQPHICSEYFVLFLSMSALLLLVLGIAYATSDQPETRKQKNNPGNAANSQEKPKHKDSFLQLCLLPILLGLSVISLLFYWKFGLMVGAIARFWLALGCSIINCTGYFLGLRLRAKRNIEREILRENHWLIIGNLIFAGLVTGCLLHWFFEIVLPITNHSNLELYATLVVPALLLTFWMATIIIVGLTSKRTTEDDREWWARAGAWWLKAGLIWIVAFVLVIYAPQWLFMIPGLSDADTTSLVSGGGALGILVSLVGYWSGNGAMLKQRAQGIAKATGMRLLDLAAIVFLVFLVISFSYLLSWGLNGFDSLGSYYKNSIAEVVAEIDKSANATEISANAYKNVSGNSDTAQHAREAIANATESAARMMERATAQMITHDKLDQWAIYNGSLESIAKASDFIDKATSALNMQKTMPEDPALKMAIAHANVAVASVSEAMKLAIAGELAESESQLSNIYAGSLIRDYPCDLFIAILLLAILGASMTRWIGVNTFSLHSMYGNRLVRAYLGATREESERSPHWFTGFDPDDNIAMANLKKGKLFHVINIALNITNASDGRQEWQQRKACSFTVTPRHAGSPSTSYVDTSSYSNMSLARAMTISGAAASPNMGYHTSSVVAFVMTFFNARLGWWLPNPSHKNSLNAKEPQWGLLHEAWTQASDESDFVYLSDGGHFENLGLYEMVRRHCKRIMVVDASCDPEYHFDDLEDAIRKIRVDLGARIEFRRGLPTPKLARASKCHYACGTVTYPDGTTGIICYIKPVLSGDEPLDIACYAHKNRDFPHQSTADQFFDEAQFESYRMLGLHSIEEMDFSEDIENENKDFWPCQGSSCKPQDNSAIARAAKSEIPDSNSKYVDQGTGFISSLGNAVSSMGHGALLATAITIGGVVGVSGTVALSDSTVKLDPESAELHLRKEDMDALKNGVQLKIDPVTINANLNATLSELGNIIIKLEAKLPTDATINKLNNQFNQIAENIEFMKNSTFGRDESIVTQLMNINNQLDQITKGLVGQPPVKIIKDMDGKPMLDEDSRAKFDSILNQLKEINAGVSAISPRRNVRGVEGAAK